MISTKDYRTGALDARIWSKRILIMDSAGTYSSEEVTEKVSTLIQELKIEIDS